MSTERFTVGMQTVRGVARPVVQWLADGRRQRKFFRSRAEARAYAADQNRERADLGALFVHLTPAQKAELVGVWNESQSAGLSLRAALEHYRAHLATSAASADPCPTVAAAITQLIAAKRTANRRPTYLTNLEVYLRAFARGRSAQSLDTFTTADIDAWLGSAGTSHSRATRLGRLGTLFSFAVRRGWLRENPTARLDRVSIERRPPGMLTVPQCQTVMEIVRTRFPDALPFVALALFAGVRPLELTRVAWNDLDLDRAQATIAAAASKVRQRRLVDLSPNCVAWLRLGGKLPLPLERWRYVRLALRQSLGGKWLPDVLRHTAASMLLARDQDAARVALQLGNSPAVLLVHYRALATRETAASFFAISPSSISETSPPPPP
jgi:integrase